jgi:hypothetical protein
MAHPITSIESMNWIKKYESHIVWLENIANIPYVREYLLHNCRGRKGRIKYQDFKVVGWTELHQTAPNNGNPGCFSRRIFWLKSYDRFLQPDGLYSTGCPVEAVDPLTVSVGEAGLLTNRAWGNYAVN